MLCRIQTLRWGGGWFPKKIFLALQASVWSKNKGGGQGRAPPPPPPPPLDPPLLQILSKNVVVVEASSQMSGKKTYSLILPFSVQRK